MQKISTHRTFLMGIAALWIFSFHFFPAFWSPEPLWGSILCFFRDQGYCGVDVFLVVSGFGITHRLLKRPVQSFPDYLRYLKERFIRIYCVVIPVALVIALVDHWTVLELLGRITGIRQMMVDICDFLWYVPCILIFYSLTPLYFAAFSRVKKKGVFTSLICLGWIVLLLLGRNWIRSDLFGMLNRIGVYLMGIYFGFLNDQGFVLKKIHYGIALLSLIAGVLLNYGLYTELIPWFMPKVNTLVNFIIAPALVLLTAGAADACKNSMREGSARRFLHAFYKIICFYGTISLEFYALQEWCWGKVNGSAVMLSLLHHKLAFIYLFVFVLVTILAFLLNRFAAWVSKKLKNTKKTAAY